MPEPIFIKLGIYIMAPFVKILALGRGRMEKIISNYLNGFFLYNTLNKMNRIQNSGIIETRSYFTKGKEHFISIIKT
jgi:hypothetical protein